jgi:hypothetical protein
MSYRKKNIIRFLQKQTIRTVDFLRFKTNHITFAGKITLVGCFVCYLSLFFEWVYIQQNIWAASINFSGNTTSFSPLVGYVGVFIFICVSLIWFSIFSLRKKEKLLFLSLIRINEASVSYYGSVFIILLTLHTFLSIGGLSAFSANILYGKGLVLSITGSIIILYGAYHLTKENKKNIKWSYISEAYKNTWGESLEEEKNNMKLPF